MSDTENSKSDSVMNEISKCVQHTATLGFIGRYSFKPEEWSQWIKRFNRYRCATNLDKQEEDKQVNFLIISMGEQAESVLLAAGINDEDEKSYDTVVKKLNRYFSPRMNITYERAKFNQRIQMENEPVSDFITEVYHLASTCDFKELKDSLIRDKLIVGITNKTLSEQLQMIPDLTLEETINRLKQNEMIKTHQITINKSSDKHSEEVNWVKKPILRNNYGGNISRDGCTQREFMVSNQLAPHCFRCGGPRHPKDECPARNVQCYYCGFQGHYSRVCKKRASNSQHRKPRLNQVQGNSEEKREQDRYTEEEYQINRAEVKKIRAATKRDNKFNEFEIDLKLDGKLEHFKIDSGADVTIVPPRMAKDKLLTKSNIVLKTPGGKYLTVLGKFEALLQYKNKTTAQTIYVIDGQEEALLGKPSIMALGFLRVIRQIKNDVRTKEGHNNQGNKSKGLQEIKNKYPRLFEGIGKMKTIAQLKLKQNTVPMALKTPRNVPIPLREKVRDELKRMVEAKIIEEVHGPTEWCHPMVVRPKPNGSVRICIDPSALNNFLQRENNIFDTVEDLLGSLGNAKWYSKLDANSGFWQIPLDNDSAKLTTFITPFGRFCFKRLPFGISTAPEIFCNRMKNIIGGIPGVLCYMDDILVTGDSKTEHDNRLDTVLRALQKEGVTLNDKCEIGKTNISFLGHIISSGEIKADPKHIQAITNFPTPTDVPSVRRFLGMLNHIGKFIKNLADIVQPLRELLKKDRAFVWGPSQEDSFKRAIKSLQDMPVLAPFSLKRKTVLSADSSAFGLGAVLLQEHQGQLKPVAYASKSLTQTQQKYAQIEKEAYAIVWACERFRNFISGLKFQIQTDHKPLIPLLSTKGLDELPLRVQRFKIRLMRYSYDIIWVPGKQLSTADTLSRAPTTETEDEDIDELAEEAEAYVRSLVQLIPTSTNKMKEIIKSQKEELTELLNMIKSGWPKHKNLISENLKEYWDHQGELSVNENIIMRNNQIVIPPSMRKEMLDVIHQGHQGINRCKERARMSVWWPRINHCIYQKVTYCPQCIAERKLPHHPMIPTEVPERPWQKIGVDFCEWKNEKYLVLIDYYSKYIDVTKVANNSSSQLITSLKTSFEKHGIPESVRSDSGVQFVSDEWFKFKSEYDFSVETSSPYHHQSNGQAESGVKIFKNILKKCNDRHLGLLAYNTTPKESGYSPSQLLMGRTLRTPLPVSKSFLRPTQPNHKQYRMYQMNEKRRQETQFNRRHRVTQEKKYPPNTKVWIHDRREMGVIKDKLDNRKYEIQTEKGGRYIRNSRFLFPMFSRRQSSDSGPIDSQANLNRDANRSPNNISSTNPNTMSANPTLGPIHPRPPRNVGPPKRLIEEL